MSTFTCEDGRVLCKKTPIMDAIPECNAIQSLMPDEVDDVGTVVHHDLKDHSTAVVLPLGTCNAGEFDFAGGECWMVLAKSIAQQLRWIWERGFTHGDVTPSNIVFIKGGTPMLVDYGRARLIGTAGFQRDRSIRRWPAAHRCMPLCASLGEWLGVHDFNTPASDAFALGVTLMMVVTGQDVILSHLRCISMPSTAAGMVELFCHLHGTPEVDTPIYDIIAKRVGRGCLRSPRASHMRALFHDVLEQNTSWTEECRVEAENIVRRLVGDDIDDRVTCMNELADGLTRCPFTIDRLPPALRVLPPLPPKRLPTTLSLRTRGLLVLTMSHFIVVHIGDSFTSGLDMLVAALAVFHAYITRVAVSDDIAEIMPIALECMQCAYELMCSPCMVSTPIYKLIPSFFKAAWTEADHTIDIPEGFSDVKVIRSTIEEGTYLMPHKVCCELRMHLLTSSMMPRLGRVLHEARGETLETIRAHGVPALVKMVTDEERYGWDRMFEDTSWCEHTFERLVWT